MRELLIRYLLGELEPHEHDAVQKQLAESAELRSELSRLRSCFANARQDDDPEEPPRGLASRTATLVSESDSYDTLPPVRTGISETADAPGGALGWSLADLTVAGGVILAVSMMLFPALRESRDGTRRSGCQYNMLQIGRLLQQYATGNSGYFPEVQPGENAGIYIVRLAERDFVSDSELSRLRICPGSSQGELMRAGQKPIPIPTQQELDTMSPQQLTAARKLMSPDYAYRLGFVLGNQYHYISSGRFRTPVLCDAPSAAANGMSLNHCGSIIQVLYSDGSVAVLTSSKPLDGHDDLYLNFEGKVDAGVGGDDSVLAPTHVTPRIFFINPERPKGALLHQQQMQPVWSFRSVVED